MGFQSFSNSFQLDAVLANYTKPRQFFQNVFAVFDDRMQQPLVYMRNHKAACTSVLLSLHERHMLLSGAPTQDLTIEDIHARPNTTFMDIKGINRSATFALIQSPTVFTFSFVRNPLERAASAFADQVTNSHRHRSRVNRYLERDAKAEVGFSEFIDLLSTDRQFGNLDRHWRPQHLELAADSLYYDYIGALEHMHEDLPAILTQGYGFEAAKVANTCKISENETKTSALVAGLTKQQRLAFEDKFEADYALYERAMRTRFDPEK